jgi:hypothetical protein
LGGPHQTVDVYVGVCDLSHVVAPDRRARGLVRWPDRS